MSYPPPPGLPSKSTSSPHPSLPARPPPPSVPANTFKPAYNASSRGSAPSYGAFTGFAPRQVAAPQPAPSFSNYQQPQPAYPQQSYGYSAAPQADPAYGAAPQIRNPFAPPGQNTGAGRGYEDDPEMAAQIAQWQSAYVGKDAQSSSYSGGYTGAVKKYPNTGEGAGSATSSNAAPLGGGPSMSSAAMTSAANNDTGVATVVSDAKTNTKTVVRSGGGTTWTDSTLLEWDPSHFRLFVGNLAGEVTDESLHKAFSRWPSLQKARVIRDKRTTKSKAYGFVSFSDGDDFFQAARDMQGKYIGSHPILLRKSTTEIKAVTPKDNRNQKGRNKNKGKDNKDKTGAGVQKAGSKTKGGLRVLG
jgi:hypothetical protein